MPDRDTTSRIQSGALRTAEARAGGHSWSNMPVESSSGQSLGSVSQVVPGLNGQQSSGYVMVSEDMQNSSDHSWRVKADHYWMHKGRHNAEK